MSPKENPRIIAVSSSAAELLGVSPKSLEYSLEYLAGNKPLPAYEVFLLSLSTVKLGEGLRKQPISHNYCGHQFGSFAGQLGDGRASIIGETMTPKNGRVELQLKGAGATPYSRFADGKAVLRSSIREFLVSEHMHALGIPTTRALSLVATDSLAERDPDYSGRVIKEKCAVVLRMSPSFLRFGSFQLCLPRTPNEGRDSELLPPLHLHLFKHFHPSLCSKYSASDEINRLEALKTWLGDISRSTARTVAKWQAFGFCHGVLNTDNMSCIGVTIDYGPFSFMDYFDRNFTCNTSDKESRYSYKNQPRVCQWNLVQLAKAHVGLLGATSTEELVEVVSNEFDQEFQKEYLRLFRQKVKQADNQSIMRGDEGLKSSLGF